MKILFLAILLKVLLPITAPISQQRWAVSGEIDVALRESQSWATQRFIKISGHHWQAATFGINIHLGPRHLTGLRVLLLIAGIEVNPGPITCSEPGCGRSFTKQNALDEHMKTFHGTTDHKCPECPFQTKYKRNLIRHQKRGHDEPPAKKMTIALPPFQPPPPPPACKKTALEKRLANYTIEGVGRDPQIFLDGLIPQIGAYVDQELLEKTGLKLQLCLHVCFFKQNPKPEDTEQNQRVSHYFWSKPLSIYRGSEYSVDDIFPSLIKAIDEYQRYGSGYVIEEIKQLDVRLVICKPLRGSCTTELPKKLMDTYSIVNIKNTDEFCFKYCVIAALKNLPGQGHPNRVSHYENDDHGLNFNGMNFPAANKDIEKFEKQNPGYAINVYCYEEEEVIPHRISKVEGGRWIHLLLYNGHYFLVRNLDRMLHHLTKHDGQLHFCPRCLMHKSSKELLDEHLRLCEGKEPTKIKMPGPDDNILKFSNIHRTLRAPVTVYADFESIEKIDSEGVKDETKSYTKPLQKHTPCGYGIQVVHNCCGIPRYDDPELYRGDGPDSNVIERFLNSISQIALDHQDKLNNPEPMKEPTWESDDCHICKKKIQTKKVRDHCHICGHFRGYAHNKCNQAFRLNRDINVVFHNLRKYDGHLIMGEIGSIAKLQGFEIDVIARAMEDYISFSLHHKKEEPGDHSYRINFIDSVQFLNNSLEGLVSNMEKEKFTGMKQQWSGDKLEKLLRKGVYPYDFMDSWDKFKESLPSKDAFSSLLLGKGISDADHDHAKQVWDLFKCTNMGQYHDLYLKTDVVLLADVFEEFRRFYMEKYGLDPCHYKTTPSLAFDACLKMTGVELELLQDPDMYMFCEDGIRGGISIIAHRYAKANNPKVKGYDPNKKLCYIIYLDANNLYGWAMIQKLPTGEFEWVYKEEDWFVDGDYGYILEVDLKYPPEKHDLHDSYPLAPESMDVSQLSPYCAILKEKMGLKIPPQKERYIVHHRTLKLYLDQGMEITKFHRALKFRQRSWMEPYIMFNTRMRAAATSSFDKDLLKLFNNAVFGKTMENVRKYKNIQLITSGPKFEKLAASPFYRCCCLFNEDLVGLCMQKQTTTLNKPIYCGLTVLDLSKELMYRFHYETIVPKYGTKAKLLFTDTDSLCYAVEGDIYKFMGGNSDKFDFSDYPQDRIMGVVDHHHHHPLYSTTNKKVPGKMKNETNGVPIEEFVGLRSKMYSILYGRVEKKRAKGIKKSVVENVIKHIDYRKVLFDEKYMHHQMTLIKSHKHQLHTVNINKKSLSAFDDKRFLLNAVDSRARGHYLNFEY